MLASPESVIPSVSGQSRILGLWIPALAHSAGMTLFCAPRKGQLFLCWRGRIERGGIGLAGRLVEALDRSRLAQIVDKLGLRAAPGVVLHPPLYPLTSPGPLCPPLFH